MGGSDELSDALFGLYQAAGTQVTYVTERGERRPYWASRLRQAIERAVDQDDVEGLVTRLVMAKPSRGFGYLEAAGRLDLTVEALVAERFRDWFPDEVVEAAEERLREYGYQPKVVAEDESHGDESEVSSHPKVPEQGTVGEFNLKVSVSGDGTLTARLVP